MVVDDAGNLQMSHIFSPEGWRHTLLWSRNGDNASNVEHLTNLGAISLPDAQRGDIVGYVNHVPTHHPCVADALRYGGHRRYSRCGKQGKYEQLFHQMSPAQDREVAA